MTEASMWEYLSKNWPGLTIQTAVLIVMVKAYLKANRAAERFYKLEAKVDRIFDYCLGKNKAIELLMEKEKNE